MIEFNRLIEAKTFAGQIGEWMRDCSESEQCPAARLFQHLMTLDNELKSSSEIIIELKLKLKLMEADKMSKFNFVKIWRYGAAAMDVFLETRMALEDNKLTTQEALEIIKTAVDGADIKGIDVDLIEIRSRDDGGFTMDFPHAAVKDWAIDFDM